MVKEKFKEFYLFIIVGAGGTFLINVLGISLPSFWGQLLIGKESFSLLPTFQDTMWVMFFIGLVLIYQRKKQIRVVNEYNQSLYLPTDFETIIDDEKLTDIIKITKKDADNDQAILAYMILQISLQFRTNNSISITSDFLSKQIDLFLHAVELAYNKLKYIIWLIPTLGFMGTVYGIGLAVNQLGVGSLDDPKLLTDMAGSLGIAFNTTLLALVLSVILQFFAQHFEALEEKLINDFGKEIMDNLINRLVEKK